jgi:hypothetical protein
MYPVFSPIMSGKTIVNLTFTMMKFHVMDGFEGGRPRYFLPKLLKHETKAGFSELFKDTQYDRKTSEGIDNF